MSQTKTDYNKWEVYGGYSNGQVDKGFDTGNSFGAFFRDRRPFNGFEASGVYNFNRYFGVKGDVTGAYNKTSFAFTIPNGTATPGTISFDTHNSLYNYLGGIQIKDNASQSRFKPFGHGLIGVGHGTTKVRNQVCTAPGCPIDFSQAKFGESGTGFAAALGGGLDIRLTEKIDFRAAQVDYNPIRFNGSTQQNVRLGVGFVFK
jgi:hypothetical protein